MNKIIVYITFELTVDRVNTATIELEHTSEDLPSLHQKAIELASELLTESYNLKGVSST
jgi:hypothetical protein